MSRLVFFSWLAGLGRDLDRVKHRDLLHSEPCLRTGDDVQSSLFDALCVSTDAQCAYE